MLLSFAQWVQSTGFFTDLRSSGYVYPVILSIHMLRVPKRWGLLLMVTGGILMACCKAEEYYYNIWFRTKLLLLVAVAIHALAFRSRVYQNAKELDHVSNLPPGAKLAGSLSLILWIGIVCAGRGIGYIEPPLDKIHAQLNRATERSDAPHQRSAPSVGIPPQLALAHFIQQ
jgi:hypothetical protein